MNGNRYARTKLVDHKWTGMKSSQNYRISLHLYFLIYIVLLLGVIPAKYVLGFDKGTVLRGAIEVPFSVTSEIATVTGKLMILFYLRSIVFPERFIVLDSDPISLQTLQFSAVHDGTQTRWSIRNLNFTPATQYYWFGKFFVLFFLFLLFLIVFFVVLS